MIDIDSLFPKKQELTKLTLQEEYDPDFWLRPKEISELFGVDPGTVARWAKLGKLEEVRSFTTPGGHHRYFKPDIMKLLENNNEDRIAT